MPPLPGEERVLTVFADIHYYFTEPTPKPLQHRFDKGSYLYLYHNAAQRKTRIEVANHPGSPEQDAFNGGLDNVHFLHSTKFPTRCTLTVEREIRDQSQQAFPPPPGATTAYEWQLPSGDPRDASRALLRLHTLDIYFWTQDDASQFLDLIEAYLPQTNISTDRHPYPPPPQSTVNPVVQQLENVAISDPAYQHGHTRGPGGESVSSTSTPASTVQTVAAPSTLPPPPPPPLGGPPPPTQQTATAPPPPAEAQRDSPQCAPLPYNPAAPAAPEPIKHREKTPPPVDAGDGTGLATAAAVDNGVPHSPPPHLTGTGPAGYAPPPPSAGLPYNSMPGGYVSPPPSAGLPPTTGFPPAPGLTHSASLSSRSSVQGPPGVPSYTPSFLTGSTGNQPVASNPPATTMSFAPPPRDPNAHLYSQPQPSPGLYAAAPPPPPVQQPVSSPPPPPIGGYSNYTYDSTPQRQQSFGSDYDVHKQLYRPTEAEANSKHQKYAQKAVQNPGTRSSKLEDSASRVEQGVSRLFKKLEKRL